MSPPRVHGLVIGIDRYAAAPEGSESPYEDLDGAVRDARKVHELLVRDLGLPAEDLRLLTSSRGLSPEPREPPEGRPGYHQILGAFREIRDRAVRGDLAFVYYSGHGVRVPSPSTAGLFDECLVPWNAARSDGRLLHDLELAFLLAELGTRGVNTVVVIDACFSGGALRAEPRVRVRGARTAGRPAPEPPSAVASVAELAAFAARRGRGPAGWRPATAGTARHTFLAACAAHELALEAPLEDGRVGGLFTAALLASLRRGGTASYRQLVARIRAALWTSSSRQTPQAEGALDRPFLGREPMGGPRGVAVLETSPDGEIRIAAGALHGIAPGALFRSPAVPLEGGDSVVLEASAVDDHSALLRPLDGSRLPAIAPGDLVGLVSPTPWRLLHRVRLIGPAAIPGLAARLSAPPPGKQRFLRLAEASEDADFQVEAKPDGRLGVWNALGEELELGPPLRGDDPATAGELARRLAHIARFEALRGLRNRDPATRLQDAVAIEVNGAAPPVAAELESGLVVTFRAVNRSSSVLYVTLLSLGADWSVEQLWPRGIWSPLEPGQGTSELRAAVELPAEASRGRTILKVLVSESPASFDWLELPPLLEPEPTPAVQTRAPQSPLEEFFAAWAAGELSAATIVRSTARDWATVEWEVLLHRRSPPRSSSG